MRFNLKYFITFIILLIVEICIALFIHDKIIRPFIGDVLVVGVVYFFVRSFFKRTKYLVVYVFLFACLVEISQYFNLVSLLHLENIKAAKIIIGSTFDLDDILCYFIGTIVLFLYEVVGKKLKNT